MEQPVEKSAIVAETARIWQSPIITIIEIHQTLGGTGTPNDGAIGSLF